ncbi:MAG: hydantoinase B/oxoprolinase family protein [Acetobacteraceae bacterium]|nr:hydantoinase B/oxoprolinase family protein [Acetobacteraceae bacterium]
MLPRVMLTLALLLGGGGLAAANAAEFAANRPVRIIVPVSPGGSADVMARIMAQALTPMWGMNQSGLRDDGAGRARPYANMFFFNGGMGGNGRRDGQTTLSWPSNVSSTSIEISEHIAPLRFRHKRLRPDSGGPGRHRGGLGQEIESEVPNGTPIAASFLAERTIFPAFGIEGGAAGAAGALLINGAAQDPKRQYALRRGDSVTLRTPGGGGHGPPAARDAAALRADLAAGYVTDAAACRD